jgi:GT2 family glycosyltransferase
MKTTIITPTTGSPFLLDAVKSVQAQTRPARHLIVIDGAEHVEKTLRILEAVWNPHTMQILALPENVGKNGFYGHRVYASVPMLVNSDYVAFLDEDNYFAKDWVEIMEQCLEKATAPVVTCRRKIVTQEGEFICNDNFESVGLNKFGYALFDTNTYLFKQDATPEIVPSIYGGWGADRPLTDKVRKSGVMHLTQYYGTFYRAPERLYQFFNEQGGKG